MDSEKYMVGRQDYNVDAKGRVFLPAKQREKLGAHVYLTRGFDDCLFVFPKDSYEAFCERLMQLPIHKREMRQVQRYYLGMTEICEVDKQGRIVLPAKLKANAKIDKQVTFVAMGKYLELWDKETLERHEANQRPADEIIEESNLGDVLDELFY